MAGRDSQAGEAPRVRLEVVSDRRHDAGILAEKFQVVSDVSRGAAEFAPERRHEERDVEDVQLLGEDVIAEAVREHHDGVVRHRAADEDRHG